MNELTAVPWHPPTVQCRARQVYAEYRGERCRDHAMPGGEFCWVHQSGIDAGLRTAEDVREGRSVGDP